MGMGFGRFLLWENGIQATGTGIWSLGMGKRCRKSKSEMGFGHYGVGFRKNWAGIWDWVRVRVRVHIPSGPSKNPLSSGNITCSTFPCPSFFRLLNQQESQGGLGCSLIR